MVLEKNLESPLDCKKIQPVNPKGSKSWIFIWRTNAEAPILWSPDMKNWLTGKDWCWERLKAGGEGKDRGWDDWMSSLTQWTWVWASSRSWWWTEKSRLLQYIESQSRTGLSKWTEVLCRAGICATNCWKNNYKSDWNFPYDKRKKCITLHKKFVNSEGKGFWAFNSKMF